MLDPFFNEKEGDLDRLRDIQEDIHEQFKDYVRNRRESKLIADERVLFSGEFWTGRRAEELGLVDGLGELRNVMREKFGEKVNLRIIGGRKRFGISQLLSGRADIADEVIAAAEERLQWDRFRL